ncbi:MAG: HD domain-containing protein [Rickettsiales bacterium]|jgi:putative hydrolase of HD superfamily|nr:HD domain-containing protein [Rickettsiales bacterium]
MLNKAKSVVDFYVLSAQLKDVIRTGWKVWGVKRDRLESVAEHIYGIQMLAIAMQSQYGYKLDIYKVIMMLAVHELEEIVIGDLTQWDITPDDKIAKGHDAVKLILRDLLKKEEIEKLVLEFDAQITSESQFARRCDKLECDIQSKLYDEQGCVDLTKQENNPIMKDKYVSELLKTGKSWSTMWLEFGRKKNKYDDNFTEVSNYVESNKISAAKSLKEISK